MTKKVKEKVFNAHKNLIMDAMTRQCGTVGKAVLEGVMNSVDADSTYCDICIDSEVIIIEDDGSGFPSEEMVDDCFNTFGHDDPEAYARKTYGNFRMGRGQMFAFGHNIWESGEFMFDVDVKTRGLKWFFHYDQETGVEGCRITIYLYNKLSPSEQATLERDLRQLVKWAPIPVTLNDEQISTDPAEAEWDYESDDCYVKLKTTGGLAVYNLGVFVKEFGGHHYGRGGEVVSKAQLKLNFARNDVMVNECPIWKEVTKFVRSQADREIARKPSMNDTERQRIADQMRASELPPNEYKKKKVFTDVLGRQHSLEQLETAAYRWPAYTNAPKGTLRGDKIHQQQLAFVFADTTLERFDKQTAPELVQLCAKLHPYGGNSLSKWKFIPFDECAEEIGSRFDLVDKKDYTEMEQIIVEMCNWGDYPIRRALAAAMNVKEVPVRQVRIGLAEAADGWTDGQTYIAIAREFAKTLHFGHIGGYVKLAELLLHEYCHDGPDTETHTHSMEFYQAYHDATHVGGVADFAEQAMRNLPNTLERLGKKMSKKLLAGQDKLHNIEQAVEALPQAARRSK